jgi:oligopeptide/dipeptide ABC transporter ATP-binding protein
VPLGAVPALAGDRIGRLVTAFINLTVAFPALLVAIFVAAIVGVGSHGAVAGIAVAIAPYFARLSQTLSSSVAGSEYLAAARMLGVRAPRLLTRHVLPNIAEPLLITMTIAVGDALLSLAGLSFLGLGVQPPQYDWGRMLNEGLDRIYVTPVVALGPAVAITIGALTFALFGEVLAKAAGASGARRWAKGETLFELPPVAAQPLEDDVLAVDDLTVSFPGGSVPVRGVTLRIAPGEIVGIVGESGSGKTLTAMAIADLLPAAARLSASRLRLFGEDPRTLSASKKRRLLGRFLAVVYQDPMSALNPALRVGRQVGEVSEVHHGLSKKDARGRAVERLRSVRIGNAEARARQYPHEFSGGMRQRAVIAMGLMAEPKLIVADEPTTALDVTVQQQILRLLRDVSVSSSSAVILISHDVAVVSQLCARVVVMYAGRVVEELDVETLVAGPAHPYTAALVASVPTMESDRARPLASIPGRAPSPFDDTIGCPFAPRCPRASEHCRAEMPPLEPHSPTHRAACWHPLPTGFDIVKEVGV